MEVATEGERSGPDRLHRNLRIGNLKTRLVLELLPPDLRLPQLQLVACGVGLRYTIPQRQSHLQADAIGRIVSPEDLAERRSIAAGGDRRAGKRTREWIRLAGKPAILHRPDQIDLRAKRIQGAVQADL